METRALGLESVLRSGSTESVQECRARKFIAETETRAGALQLGRTGPGTSQPKTYVAEAASGRER